MAKSKLEVECRATAHAGARISGKRKTLALSDSETGQPRKRQKSEAPRGNVIFLGERGDITRSVSSDDLDEEEEEQEEEEEEEEEWGRWISYQDRFGDFGIQKQAISDRFVNDSDFSKQANMLQRPDQELPGNSTSTTAGSDASKTFRFLDLPPELRNKIYQIIAETSMVMLSRCKQDNITTDSALSRVNKQIRSEFVAAACHAATDFSTVVRDLDFSHIVTFLNKLPAILFKAALGVQAPEERCMEVRLVFSDKWRKKDGVTPLKRWVKRVADPTKKGTKFKYNYFADLTSKCAAGENEVWERLEDWYPLYFAYAIGEDGERAAETAGAILDELQN